MKFLPKLFLLVAFIFMMLVSNYSQHTEDVSAADACVKKTSRACPVGKGIGCYVNGGQYCCDSLDSCNAFETENGQPGGDYGDINSNPVPPPRVPCYQQGEDPEFHSLRPYQASPCGKPPQALFCGNKVVIKESYDTVASCDEQSVKVNWINQEPGGGPKKYWIDISEAEFPIAGNTEQVKNSQSPKDNFDDPTKVNEYASWYLSGVNNRAEYGETKNTDDEIVNFSGPVQKLLPQAILQAQRIQSIKNASESVTYEDEDTSQVTDTKNHNQIAVCYKKQIQLLPGWLTNLLGINSVGLGDNVAVECYDGGNKPHNETALRLKSWDQSPIDVAKDLIRPYISKLLPDNLIGSFLDDVFVDRWSKKIPPLPWEFDDEEKYTKAYKEWRGDWCAFVPIPFTSTEKLFCVGIPGITNNEYADLFPFIPLANTADKNAKMPIFFIVINESAGVNLVEDDPRNVLPNGEPVFYYPHTYEIKELSELLNKSHTPEGVEQELPTNDTEKNFPSCKVADVRSNNGDDLFPIGGDGKHDIGVEVYFRVDQIPCNGACYVNNDGESVHKCSGEVSIEVHTDPVKVPNGEEIWKNTVAGTNSAFRKIFPKVEEGAPVSCIADIPSVTKAVYKPIQGTNSISVVGPLGSSEESNMDSNDAKIYFPHFGSVYDYFLKGIQTALRPKGFGTPIASGQYCTPPEESKNCEVNVPDSAVDSKYLGSFKSNFIDLANRWTTDCPGAENNLAEECYNYVASESKKAGVNPAFALTIWLNESGASNYCHGGETTQDFGINLSNLYQDIVGQLEAFLNMAKQKLCSGVSGFVEPMHGWLSRYQSSAGICDPNDQVATDYYYEVMGTTWSFLTSCVKNGKFGIEWPTDMSCP